MSKRFLTRFAGGVALGSAALLLGTPAAAFASDGYDGYDNSKTRDHGGVVCATNKQINELLVANIISDNSVEDSEITIRQDARADARNENERGGGPRTIICVGDVDLELELELDGPSPFDSVG